MSPINSSPERITKPIVHNRLTPGILHEKSADSTLTAFEELQHQLGNRVIQRIFAQRSGNSPFELDDDTAKRIDHERSGGQSLDEPIRSRMEESTGQELTGVQVHTSSESDTLNTQIGAKAFTTGNDIFFSEGSYQPSSTTGQELIAHEVAHVVQQKAGLVGNPEKMTVNAPGDSYEQEADAVAKSITTGNSPESSFNDELDDDENGQVHRQEFDDDEKQID